MAAGAAIVAAALVGWALLWPDAACAQPACARGRFDVGIEVDALGQVEPIEFDVPTADGRMSLRSILHSGGIEVDLEIDQLDLPYHESSGPLDRADLFQFASAWRSAPRAGTDATVYAVLTSGLISDNGEPLFGIMFDIAGREGFALAPATTARFFGEHEPDAVPTLQLRTFVHELLHALNRHHVDAVAMGDGRLTLEAPTRCISRRERGRAAWSLLEPPLLAISPSTIRFFQTAAAGDVLPGTQHSSFDLQRASPTECDDARARISAQPAVTRWQLAGQRLKSLLSIPTARAAASSPMPDPPSGDGRIELRLQAQPATYPLGYPVAVRVVARNDGDVALPLGGRLDPAYGMVSIQYRRADASAWQDFQPLAFFESIGSEEAMVEPGEQTEQTIPVYYDQQGWTFKQPGDYELRTRLQTDDPGDTISNPVLIRIEEPRADVDRAVLQPLLDADAHLDDRVGRLLIFGGRIGQPADIKPLEAAAEAHGHTALGAALRLTLASQRLRPPIDPRTGERPLPDLGAARALLQDTCADSGIAALREQLLARTAAAVPDDAAVGRSSAVAWDGTGFNRGEPVTTYSDPRLHALGPSLHFCFDEAGLRARVDRELPRLARKLRRARPARIVVVGHTDYEGSCRRNEELARRRAQTVRRALIHYGVRGASIEIATLGERRPLDFATTREAHTLNRRVEILVEAESGLTSADEPPQRIVPAC
jgi:outer membrane protein OmpA-like peptidoglycan-associated protein